jgi:hypothetical protein
MMILLEIICIILIVIFLKHQLIEYRNTQGADEIKRGYYSSY